MARLSVPPSNFASCLTIGEAAEFLGVSAATLRNWDRAGKLKPRRHPQNGYRIYLHEDLEAVLRSAELPQLTPPAFAPQIDWSETKESGHFVQFYENDEFLLDSVTAFIETSLSANGYGLVVATPEHRESLHRKLAARGLDLAAAAASGQYVELDAADALSQFMVNGAPDRRRFEDSVGKTIARLTHPTKRLHAFGEMVAILWMEGNRDGAIALEQLWNELSQRHRFALLCAYPISGLGDDQSGSFADVCSCHNHVIPAESYAATASEDQRLRSIALLQQKAHSLSTEIEHRQEIQHALSKRERELSDFFENATEGLHKVGADGTILWANKADFGLLGYSAEEYIGQPITDFHADPDVIADVLNKLQRGESLDNFAARLRCKNGAIKHVQITSNTCFDDGKFAYTRCFTRDVTQQWQAEKNLLEADRRKDEFLATLSHELRSPLAPIRNALELIDGGAVDAHTQLEAAHVIRRQVDQLTRLVDDLLDISRITRGKIELRKQDVELAAVVNNAIETSRPSIEAADHELVVNLPNAPVLLHADSARLSQVFSNLLHNAAKFTPAGGRIELNAVCESREIIVSVSDNGVGICREALVYVFDMFRQVDHSLERSQGGLGMGLSIVRRLVELHGGTANAQSEGPNKGSQFTVRLPLADTKATVAQVMPSAKAAPIKRRILVVDDNKDSGDTLSLLLRVKGHEVYTARDGLEAIDRAGEFTPEIILMDLGMPKLNGYEATRRIRETPNGKKMHIVALTGWGQASDIARSVEAGCTAHLVKPVDFAMLDNLLANLPAS
ncbi:MAG TPA: ATP-binding protein [Lacipirellulaceae bacterium]|jgi:PAS domain S-box-containing protein|nr:ATP-binding protein [Lacipirellulaceae bacterium]